jgi:hypothetical protein
MALQELGLAPGAARQLLESQPLTPWHPVPRSSLVKAPTHA